MGLCLAGAGRVTAQLPVDPSLLVPRRDSMVVSVRGVPLGWQTSELARANGGLRVVDHVSLGEILEQRTEVQLGRDGRIRWVRQGGILSGVAFRTSLEYDRTRVRGVTIVPTPQGGATVLNDAPLPPGALDDNAIALYLPALPWGPDAKWSFPEYVSSSDTVRTMTLHVTGPAAVSLPSGTVQTWQVELSGGPTPVVYFVTQSAPHRLARMELTGAGLVFVLVN